MGDDGRTVGMAFAYRVGDGEGNGYASGKGAEAGIDAEAVLFDAGDEEANGHVGTVGIGTQRAKEPAFGGGKGLGDVDVMKGDGCGTLAVIGSVGQIRPMLRSGRTRRACVRAGKWIPCGVLRWSLSGGFVVPTWHPRREALALPGWCMAEPWAGCPLPCRVRTRAEPWAECPALPRLCGVLRGTQEDGVVALFRVASVRGHQKVCS